MTSGHTILGRDDLGRKWCPKCQAWKYEKEFGKHKREPDGLRRWCSVCINENSGKYKNANREKLNKESREWRNQNPKKLKEYWDNFERRNPEKIREYGLKKRIKRAKVPGKIKASEMKDLWDFQDGRCAYCGVELERTKNPSNLNQCQIDHVIPISRGGHHVIKNIVWACRRCNSSKGSKLLNEWRH